MSGSTQDYIARMENSLLPDLEAGQVWITRSPISLREHSLVLLAPKPHGWDSPYELIRTKVPVGLIPLRGGTFSELDLAKLGGLFMSLREGRNMTRAYWSSYLFTYRKRPLHYIELFSYQPWE